jgi:hypothetical protein
VSRSQNAATQIIVSNSNNNAASYVGFQAISNNSSDIQLFKNSTTSTAYKILSGGDGAIYNNQVIGDIAILNDFATGKIKFAAGGSSTAQMTLTAAGRLLLGTTTEGTFLLDVNGTARVSDNLTVSKNQNAATQIIVSNSNNNASSFSGFKAISNGSSDIQLFKNSSTSTAYKILSGGDGAIYNNQVIGDIAILNDFATGNIKFAAGGSSTAHMTIKSNGRINMSSLPTSATGLSAGDIWNDGGTLKIV